MATASQWADVLLDEDEVAASEALEAEAARHGDRATFFLDVVAPAMREIGARWAANEIGVADEHRASAIVAEVLARLPARPPPGPARKIRAIVACVEGEPHALAARMVADAALDRGWRVTYLGASVPNREIARYAARARADVALLSVASLLNLRSARGAVEALRRAVPSTVVAVGGRGIEDDPALAEGLRADLTGSDLPAVLERVEALLARRAPRPAGR